MGEEKKFQRFVFIFVICTHQSPSIVRRNIIDVRARCLFVRRQRRKRRRRDRVSCCRRCWVRQYITRRRRRRIRSSCALALAKCLRRRCFITDMKLRWLVRQNYWFDKWNIIFFYCRFSNNPRGRTACNSHLWGTGLGEGGGGCWGRRPIDFPPFSFPHAVVLGYASLFAFFFISPKTERVRFSRVRWPFLWSFIFNDCNWIIWDY